MPIFFKSLISCNFFFPMWSVSRKCFFSWRNCLCIIYEAKIFEYLFSCILYISLNLSFNRSNSQSYQSIIYKILSVLLINLFLFKQQYNVILFQWLHMAYISRRLLSPTNNQLSYVANIEGSFLHKPKRTEWTG